MSSTESRGVFAAWRRTGVCLVAGVALLAASATGAPGTSCGATIVADLKLDEDLTCAGAGLVAGADGITIDLNGHSITGSGAGTGILVSGRAGVSIRGGALVNFVSGVLVTNSTDLSIQGNTFLNNTDGIDLQTGSTEVTIKENTFLNSRARGVMLRGGTAANTVTENGFAGNRVGILVNGAVATTVKENLVETSGQFGIRVGFEATGNLVLENIVSANPIGIDFLAGAGGPPIGNTFRENTITANGCGLKGPFGGNSFSENLFTANGADVCS